MVLGIAIVGLGMASKPHVAALSQLENDGVIKVHGVFVRSPEKIAVTLAEQNWRYLESIDEIIKNRNIDAVIVLTPPNARQKYVQSFAKAGKHLLIEKPIERTLSVAVSMVKYCENSNVFLGVVFQHRYRDGSKKLRDLVDQNSLGTLQLVNARIPWWRDQSYYDGPGRGTFERDGGGVLISQAIHTLDLMLVFTGQVEEVQALTATSDAHSMEAEDFASAGLKFSCGAVGSVMATTSLYPGGQESLEFVFSKGTATLTGGALSIKWRDGQIDDYKEESETGGGADPMAFPSDWHRLLISDFVAAVSSGIEPEVTGKEALKVHRLIDGIVRSANEGRRIYLDSNCQI